MSFLNIGWIGSGFVGQVAHLNLYEDIELAKIKALSELRERLGKKVIVKNNIPKFYKDYDEMIKNERLDAIILIVNRNHTAYHAKRILKKKINLFTEKPQAPTYDEAKTLVNLATKNKLTYACGLMRRHDEGIKYAKVLIEKFKKSKEFGNLIGADFFCFAGGDYCNIGNYLKTNEPKINKILSKKFPKWLNPKFGKYYEEFLNVFIHDIDLITYLLGKKSILKKLEFNKNKMSHLLLEVDGSPVTFRWRNIQANQWYEGFSIYFEKGSIDVEMQPAFLKNVSSKVIINKYGKGGLLNKKILENFSFRWSFYNQHIDFLNCIKNKTNPISACEETLVSMKLVDEVFKNIN